MGLPAVPDLQPPLGSPARGLRPALRLAAGPQPAGVPGLPRTVGAVVKMSGPEVLLGGAGGLCGGELRPPANPITTVRGAPTGLDILNFLATQIPTLHRVPVAASSSCARALTWEALARLLSFPRIASAAPPRGGEATRSPSTQQCRLNCLASIIDPLEELVSRIGGPHRQMALARGPGPRRRQQRPRIPRTRPRTGRRRLFGPSWPREHRVWPSSC